MMPKIKCVCRVCRQPYMAWPHAVRTGRSKYCSHACRVRGPKRPRAIKTAEALFWERTKKTQGCWLWTGTINPDSGYGQFFPGGRDSGKTVRAHRFSYEIHHGTIPPGLRVCHNCDVNYPVGDVTYRRCVRPDHLFLGTDADNIRDAAMKGRLAKGESHGRSALTASDVTAARRRYASGLITIPQLASELHVGTTTVWNFLRRITWRHID